MNIAEKFTKLKTRVAGNIEATGFEFTFRLPETEQKHIADMPRSNKRILSELEFALHLSEANGGVYDGVIEKSIDFLSDILDSNGTLSNADCDKAEEILLPLEKAAKEIDVILISHAHIDMNWQWGYDETVAITLSTFRTILNIMNEYPDFTYMQSQASVYKIVEEHDPEMMEEIKERIREGRWEVTATAWVEPDKNMPCTESLIRHIEYSRKYLESVWDVKNFDIDFVPDTFGHSANVPEINNYGGVKYYYHCRGNKRPETLYRYRALSGKEVLVYREPVWYNGSVTSHIGSSAVEIVKLSGGFKTVPFVYGVGDHGGGPTRRDIERALEMMEWRIYPTLRFGSLNEYFKKAESMRDSLPVVNEEMNFIFPGCYTTQSRIKYANRHLEASLYDAEAMSALACKLTDFRYAEKPMTEAWRNVLFNHFHDIITGSCVPESREHAMGLYQASKATVNTQLSNAMRKIGLLIDTSSIDEDVDSYYSKSEGAGVGYNTHNFAGVPSTERGGGKTRIFHLFNTLAFDRTETVELTVWDWMGDIKRMSAHDFKGNPVKLQVVDTEPQPYWDHRYNRVLVEVSVSAMGYTTIILSEKEAESYPVYLQDDAFMRNRGCNPYDDFTLENEFIKATVDIHTGRLVSLIDKKTGAEQISGEGAGFTFIETENSTSDAWKIGRHISRTPVTRCLDLKKTLSGVLCTQIRAQYDVEGSKVDITYSLDKDAHAVRIDTKIDWRHHGMDNDIIPVLDYRVPLSYKAENFTYDIPAGAVTRKAINHDVPALSFGMAQNGDRGTVLVSDCKYGYMGSDNALSLTLINSSTKPDRYPELGNHIATLWVGVCDNNATSAKQLSLCCNHKLIYSPSNSHKGTLPMEYGMLSVNGAIVSAIKPISDGKLLVRMYETDGKDCNAEARFNESVKSAHAIDLWGNVKDGASLQGNTVKINGGNNTITAIEVEI